MTPTPSEERAGRRLEVGMLLLGDNGPGTSPVVWTVKSVLKQSAHVLAHHGSCVADARLRTATLPTGWRILNNDEVVQAMLDRHTTWSEGEQP